MVLSIRREEPDRDVGENRASALQGMSYRLLSLSTADALSYLLKSIVRLMRADGASIISFGRSGRISIKESYKINSTTLAQITDKLRESVNRWLESPSEGERVVLNYGDEDARKSFYYTPIVDGNVPLGSVVVVKPACPEDEYKNDLKFLASASDLVSYVIQRERSERALLRLREKAESLRRVKKQYEDEIFALTFVDRLNSAFSTVRSVEEIGKVVMDILGSAIPFHIGGIIVRYEDNIYFIVDTHNERLVEGFKSKMEVLYAVHSGDYAEEGAPTRTARKITTRSRGLGAAPCPSYTPRRFFQGIPMEAPIGGQVIGILGIERDGSDYTRRELRLLALAAGRTATAIDNALLFKRMEQLSITDGLTGLYIHRYFQEFLDEEIRRIKGVSQRPGDRRQRRYSGNDKFSLIMIDIDNFKSVNDTYGHMEGDVVLINVARILKSNVRDVDVVARYGGEEFAIIVPQVDVRGAAVLAERIRRAVESNEWIDNIPLTISLGVATFPDDAQSRDELIEKADRALYKAKRAGRNRVCLANQE
ncbi:MAG: sensor domain-containing diguanylate cyclase [bacterium]